MGLKDKVARLDFSQLPGLGANASPAEPRPKTAPGQMMAFANDARSALLRENEALKGEADKARQLEGQLAEAVGDLEQWKDAKATRLLGTESIVRSPFANRHTGSMAGPDFEQLKADIRDAGGNVQPIKVRVLPGSDPQRFEIVFGHRRYEACRQLGLKVLAVVDNLDDRALFIEMDRENRARKDLSPWEQGVMYRRALDEKLFSSNRKLAEAVGVDLGAVGKAIALAGLPDEVVAAFPSPMTLQYRWAKPLSDALAAQPDVVKARARRLGAVEPRKTAREVLEALLAAEGRGVEPFNPPAAATVEVAGRRIARVSANNEKSITVQFDDLAVTEQVIDAIASALKAVAGGGAGAPVRRGRT